MTEIIIAVAITVVLGICIMVCTKEEHQTQVLFCIIGIYMSTIICAITHTERKYREKSIEAGVAEWTINPKTGDKEFKYLTNPNKPNELNKPNEPTR